MLPKFYKIKINGKLLPPSKIFCNVEKMCIDAVCVKNNELAPQVFAHYHKKGITLCLMFMSLILHQ